VAFLINGIVLGVHDVSDGSSETALDALKAELQKMGKSCSDVTHIVSSTSDGASFWRKRVENHKELLLKTTVLCIWELIWDMPK